MTNSTLGFILVWIIIIAFCVLFYTAGVLGVIWLWGAIH